MRKLIHLLNEARAVLPSLLLLGVAATRAPHFAAHNGPGIRILALGPRNVQFNTCEDDVRQALLLLARFDPRRMARVSACIRFVFVASVCKGGFYLHPGKICLLNFASIPGQYAPTARHVALAGMLVHEATHGLLNSRKIPYCGRLSARIENLCELEQVRCVRRLARAGAEDR